MDDSIIKFRGAIANHAIIDLHYKTKELVDKLGDYEVADLYLQAQLAILRNMRRDAGVDDD